MYKIVTSIQAFESIKGKLVNYSRENDQIIISSIDANHPGYILMILKILFYSGFSDVSKITIGNDEYDLNNKNIEKEILYYYVESLSNIDHDFSFPYFSLRAIVENNNITTMKQLKLLSNKPYSGIMTFEQWDRFELLGILDDGPIKVKNSSTVVITNRFINDDIDFSRAEKIIITDCVICGKLVFGTVDSVEVHKCIIIQDATFIHVNNITIDSCNINFLKLINAPINKFHMSSCNILNFSMLYTNIEECIIRYNKISMLHIEGTSVPDGFISLSQIDIKKINPIIQKQKHTANDKFLLKFYKQKYNHKEKYIYSRATLATVHTLLDKAYDNHNRQWRAALKYNYMLLSNSKFKKLFVFITGGYYKPFRFVMFFLLLNILMLFIHMASFNQFENNSIIYQGLSITNAFLYSLDLLLGTEIAGFKAIGLSQIVLGIHKILNTILIAGFFTALIKNTID